MAEELDRRSAKNESQEANARFVSSDDELSQRSRDAGFVSIELPGLISQLPIHIHELRFTNLVICVIRGYFFSLSPNQFCLSPGETITTFTVTVLPFTSKTR